MLVLAEQLQTFTVKQHKLNNPHNEKKLARGNRTRHRMAMSNSSPSAPNMLLSLGNRNSLTRGVN